MHPVKYHLLILVYGGLNYPKLYIIQYLNDTTYIQNGLLRNFSFGAQSNILCTNYFHLLPEKKMTTYSSNSMSSIPDLISSSVSLDLGKVVKIDKFVVDGTHYIVKY